MITLAAATMWCVVQFNVAFESAAPRACFEQKDTCRAYISQLSIPYADCQRRAQG